MTQFFTGHQTMPAPGQNDEPRRTKLQVNLHNPQSRDGPGDHELLDLFGTFEDVVDLIWTYPLVALGAVYVR